MKRNKPIFQSVAVVIGGLWLGLSCQPQQSTSSRSKMPITQVTVVQPQLADIAVSVMALGTVTAIDTATIRSQVDGLLLKTWFHEGDMVEAQALLATLDLRPFDIAIRQAASTLHKDEATLKNNHVNTERYRQLVGQKLLAEQVYTDALAVEEAAAAQVEADKAALQSAELNWKYAHIRAPFAGRLGLRRVDPGNILHTSEPNGLVTLTQLDPIAIIFSLPQEYLAQFHTAVQDHVFLATATDANTGLAIASSDKVLLDNQIDTTTGTLRFKAFFSNHDQHLWPNQFVKVEVRLQQMHQTMVLPSACVQLGPKGRFVFVVGKNDIAQLVGVTTQEADQDRTAILSSLTLQDRVIQNGLFQVQAGHPVHVVKIEPP